MMVTHGLFRINGKKVDIPSYVVKTNDVVEVAEKKKTLEKISNNVKSVDRRGMPEWLSLDRDGLKGTVKRLPVRSDVTVPVSEHLIVELYSK